MRARREALARAYDDAFVDLPCELPSRAPAGETHAWHLYPIRLTDEAPLRRNAFIEAMSAAGIGCSVHFIPLHMLRYWRETYALDAALFPVATDVFERIVSLPLYSKMSDAEQERVIEVVRGLLG
jgi:dTDP-4-amino-4,6-dideoxygalactose transaminase